MGDIILVTGGARSGKSAFTEDRLKEHREVCYIATGVVKGQDPDWSERIRRHQARRPSSWVTYEGYDLLSWLKKDHNKIYLLDSATMLTTNRLFDLVEKYAPEKKDLEDEYFLTEKERENITEDLLEEWRSLLAVLKKKEVTTWIVTDEVGLGIVPETRLGRFFRDIQGSINQLIAKEASQVHMIICGIAQQIK